MDEHLTMSSAMLTLSIVRLTISCRPARQRVACSS